MKNPKITLTKDGLKLVDAPEKPDFKKLRNDKNFQDYKFFSGYTNTEIEEQYTQALEQAIKEGVFFKEEMWYRPLILQGGYTFEQGKLYDIPEGYRAVIWKPSPTNKSKWFAVLEQISNQYIKSICSKCGAEYIPHLIKPLTICDACHDALIMKFKSGDDNPVPEKSRLEQVVLDELKRIDESGQIGYESTPVIEQKEEHHVHDFKYTESTVRQKCSCGEYKPESKQLTPTIEKLFEMVEKTIIEGNYDSKTGENLENLSSYLRGFMPLPKTPQQ